MIRAIFFDLDGTLCDSQPAWDKAEQETFDHFLARHPDITEQDLRQSWKTVHIDLFNALNTGRMNMAEVRQVRFPQTLNKLNISNDQLANELNILLATRRLSYLTPYDGALELLASLRPQFHVGIITNGAADDHPDSQPSTAKQIGVLNQVDSFWVSDAIGHRKPAPEIFQAALDAAHIAPQEAVYIGDSPPQDIAGANRTGMLSILVGWTARQPSPDRPEEHPGHTVQTFSDIPTIIDKITL